MTAEVIEGIAREVHDEPERGLAVVPEVRGHLMSGLGAVALLSDVEFDQNLELLAKAKARAQLMQKALLTEGTDYGTVPGISRPFLHKPGAEIFEKAYGLATSYEVERKIGDGIKTPELEYIVHAKVHLRDTDGPVIGEGLGSCNSHESKYRYRLAERVCPVCGQPAVIKGKAEYGGGWLCFKKKDGCGAKWPDGAAEIESQIVGRVENENPYDLANTILKMARKRAGVDGILTSTGTSGLFTQDDDSPAVAGDAGPSGGGGQAQGTTAAAPWWKGQKITGLPAIPQGITEETSLGQVRLAGSIVVTDKQKTDGQLRQGPHGAALGFRLDIAAGGNAGQIVVRGPLAEQLAATDVAGNELGGRSVVIAGEMFANPWKKKNEQTGQMEAMPPSRRLEVASIEGPNWKLPADAEQPKAAPKSRSKPKADPGPDVPGGAREADHAAANVSADAAEAMADKPGGDPNVPGMTTEAFQKALDARRVAGPYALQFAKGKWPEAETLFGLTDQQRLELAVDLDLLTEEED